MKLHSLFLVGASALMLAGCQTTQTYEKIGYGPDLEYSKARCEIGAMSVEQGMYAFGSPGFVLGAQIGNAIGNEIRKNEFLQRCMILHGWKGVPAGQKPKAAQTSTAAPQQQAQHRQPVGTQAPSHSFLAPPSGPVVARQ